MTEAQEAIWARTRRRPGTGLGAVRPPAAVNARAEGVLRNGAASQTAPADIRLIAFYLPQFHPIAENDRWWGPGFTDWRNVVRATPLFEGHYQPRLPGALGFYDLRMDEVRRQQVKLAKEYGVYGFCYYFYWFNGRRVLERPLEQYVADREIDFPFCICWANENWSRRWDGGNHEVLLVQEHSLASDIAFIRTVIPLFKDPRYIRVDGMPLLVLYRADLLKDPAATAAEWRRECERAGLPGVHLCLAQTFGTTDPRPFGFDSACEFPPHAHAVGQITDQISDLPEGFDGWVCDYEMVARHSLTAPPPHYTLYRGLFPSWDNSARKRKQALIFHRADPKRYEYWLRGLIQYTRQNLGGDRRIIFVNAWNEWAEGAHLEPDLKHGSAYLEATQRALGGQTDAEQLIALLGREIESIGDPALRERIDAYAREICGHVRQLTKTVEYFTAEKEMVERFRQERAAAAFHRQTIQELLGHDAGNDVECWFERINGRSLAADPMLDQRITVHLEGWLLCPGVVPDAENTARFILLQDIEHGDTYAAQVFQYWLRQDVVEARPHVDSLYTLKSGFGSLFSLSKVPAGTYRLGCAIKDNHKAAYQWTERRVRLTP